MPESIRNLGIYGVIREAEVDPGLIPDGAVTDVQNFHFDQKGASTVRLGLTALGSTVLTSRPAIGLHNVQSNTAIVMYGNGSSSTIYSFGTSSTAGAWAVSLDGGTASVKIRAVDFAGYTIVPNFIYNTLSSMRFWDGGTRNWKNTGNPINPQNMWGYNINLVEAYKSRVYGAGDPAYPSRLFFSSVISSAGNITWSPTIDYVDINPGDGEDTTGLKRYSTELLFFKPNYMYRFKTQGVDPDPLIKIGTRSHESIIEAKKGIYFHHDTGFYRYDGNYPIEISRAIIDFINNIPYSQYANIISWKDQDHVYWSVGNVTIPETLQSTTWKNCVLRYTESADLWTIYSYASDVRRAITYNNGSSVSQIVGLDNGVVATVNSGNTDMGEPIKFRMRTKWYEWGGIYTRSFIEELCAIAEKAQGMELSYQVDERYDWQPIAKTGGQLKKMINFFYPLSLRFHRIKFQISGIGRGEPAIFRGLEIYKIDNEGIIKEK